jgi:ribose transport system ATP-binding protein
MDVDTTTRIPVLRVRDLSKTFIGQRALDGVELEIGRAEVHAIIGHNGSGKSTLIKILAGYHVPDAGSGPVEVGGKELRFGDPDSARRLGLRFIHQELGLVDSLSVLENLRLGGQYEVGPFGQIRWREERRRAAALLARVGLDIHPEALVSALSPIERTQLAVARAVQDEDVAVVLFDEPTATLPGSEVERLFALIRRLTDEGVAVGYVSHRLEELPQIADAVTVLRNGRVAGAGPMADFDRARLTELIVGHPLSQTPAVPPKARAVATGAGGGLDFEGVAGGELNDATFSVQPGEIVGLAGLVGSGVHDLPNLLLDRVELEAGALRVDGEPVRKLTPEELRGRGIAVLPSARHLRNLPSLSVRENLTLPDLRPLWRGLRLRMHEEERVAADLVRRFGVQPPNPERVLAELSGGNQQKVCVAKWLRTKPRFLILDEPTQGVDVGGKEEILGLLREASEEGLAVLLCSSDLEDLELVCSRVLIMRGGRIGTELSGAALTRETMSNECYRDEVSND